MAGLEVQVNGYGLAALDRALSSFKRLVSSSGILAEVKSRRYYRPPSIIRKQKKAVKREKSRKNALSDKKSGW